jgi:endonuclease/exonuclease/phosphatase family metal-dependent hydrolase
LLLTACERRPASAPPPTSTPAATQPAARHTAAPRESAAGNLRPARPFGQPTNTFLDRDNPEVVRLMSYNVEWNSIFPAVSQPRAEKFARLVAAVSPDILALQEIGTHPEDRDKPNPKHWTGEEVAEVLQAVAPLPPGEQWHAYQGADNVVVSRWPLRMTRDETAPAGQRKQAIALIDVPDSRWPNDIYLLNNHFKCCGGTANDPQRQQQADAIVAWLRDARAPGGEVDLPPETALIIAGDLNTVGGPQPLLTLLAGDVQNEAQYGVDFKLDWDETELSDARPLHNLAGPDDYTWRNDSSEYKPGRLDYVLYSDSVLTAVKAYTLNTTVMLPAELDAAGLQKYDMCSDDEGVVFDHLPLVVDFAPRR